ncbi:MAG TPA: sulfatase-like hydrolase/transferase [Polyangia bacterium]|nr:sulfatase-like hydrolase/transferase [Polyangia bacterium]
MSPPPDERAIALTPAWIVAGGVAGLALGLLDAATAIEGGIGGLSGARTTSLFVVAASALALTGVVAGVLVAALGRLARRGAPDATERQTAFLATLVAAPIVFFDAFALFSGPKAARVPAHGAISVALGILGTAAIAAAVRGFAKRLGRARAHRLAARVVSVVLVAVVLALHSANRHVLPRLYPWFHATLAAATLALAVAAVRLLVETGPRRLASAAGAVAMVLVAVSGLAVSIAPIASSPVLRYAAHERTALTSLALRAVPARVFEHHAPTVAHADVDQGPALPPLPEGPKHPDADVLLITIDALRADHVGAYGYPRATTPNIDRLAAHGVRFARAYSQAPHTSFSVASMLTGKYFPTLARLAPGEKHTPIAEILRTYGWRTAAFYPPAVFYVDAAKTRAFAETNFGFEYVKFEYIDAQRRTDQVLTYYDTIKPKKSFVWVHFFEPHEPYEAHADFPFGSGDVDRYDSEIAYTDAAVGRLIRETRRRRPGTVVIVAADHGEEFDEHGGRYHGSTLYEEQLHIPLVISVPGTDPGVVADQVQLIDVTPTVLTLLDIPVPARMRGTDLGPWLATPPAPASRLPPAFAEVEDRRAMIYRNEKLLCDLRWGFCAYYDLATDPGEKHNLAEERPEPAAAMRARLDEWLDGHVRLEPLLARGASNPDGGPVPRAIERGRLGDLLAAADLAALMNDTNAPLAQRREAAQLLVGLPARSETAAALVRAAGDPDVELASWASVGAVRLGNVGPRDRVRSLAIEAGDAGPPAATSLRVRAALALADVGDATGVPALGAALDRCDDVLICRFIIGALGKLRDRRAVPALLRHLPEVQNRREMVDALGDIGDPSAEHALVERLHGDEYVTVRVQSAVALAKIGARSAIPELERAEKHDTEATVVAAARDAVRVLSQPKP